MEFKGTKGTKGKWYSEYKSGYWKITDDEREGSIAEVYFFNDGKDTAEHNAKLIEKAPEMLEMLKELLSHYEDVVKGDYSPFALRSDIDKAKQLIKEATEL